MLIFIYYLLWQLAKDIYDEHEDVTYSWIREYHWDVCVRHEALYKLISFSAFLLFIQSLFFFFFPFYSPGTR